MVEESVLRVRRDDTGRPPVAARTVEPPPPEWRGLFREPDWPPTDEED